MTDHRMDHHNEPWADFFRTDLQDYQPRIDAIAKVLADGGQHDFLGDGYELQLSSTTAQLRAKHAKLAAEMSVDSFRAAFDAWVKNK